MDSASYATFVEETAIAQASMPLYSHFASGACAYAVTAVAWAQHATADPERVWISCSTSYPWAARSVLTTARVTCLAQSSEEVAEGTREHVPNEAVPPPSPLPPPIQFDKACLPLASVGLRFVQHPSSPAVVWKGLNQLLLVTYKDAQLKYHSMLSHAVDAEYDSSGECLWVLGAEPGGSAASTVRLATVPLSLALAQPTSTTPSDTVASKYVASRSFCSSDVASSWVLSSDGCASGSNNGSAASRSKANNDGSASCMRRVGPNIMAVCCGRGKNLMLYDARDAKGVAAVLPVAPSCPVQQVAVSCDGNCILAATTEGCCGFGRAVDIVEVRARRNLLHVPFPSVVSALDVAPTNPSKFYVAVGSQVAAYDMSRQQATPQLEVRQHFVHSGHCARVRCIAPRPNADFTILSCADDNRLHVWTPAV